MKNQYLMRWDGRAVKSLIPEVEIKSILMTYRCIIISIGCDGLSAVLSRIADKSIRFQTTTGRSITLTFTNILIHGTGCIR